MAKKLFKVGDKVKTNYDIACDAYKLPAGTICTITCRDLFFKAYDIESEDGRWMTDIEEAAFIKVE